MRVDCFPDDPDRLNKVVYCEKFEDKFNSFHDKATKDIIGGGKPKGFVAMAYYC